jgi:hypothetical protein
LADRRQKCKDESGKLFTGKDEIRKVIHRRSSVASLPVIRADEPGEACDHGTNGYSGRRMNPNIPPPAIPPAGGPAGTPVRKRRPWLLYGCGLLIGMLFLMCATVAITIWYIQRPIKPVVLSAAEKAAVEEKLEDFGAASDDRPRPAIPDSVITPPPEPDRAYVPGSKVLRLTERELNGLLNANTDLGQTVRLELGRDAINAYVAAPIPQDVPLFGGRMFRARGRFRVSLTDGAAPYVILEDVTVFGLSLPKAWLGGLKGENLLAEAVGDRHGAPVLRGVKSLRVEPGVLVLEVED